MPNSNGIFSRLCSTAIFCMSRMFFTPLRLNSPPTSPRVIFPAMSLLLACPVTIVPVTERFSCPIFSCSVILAIRSSINRFILPSSAACVLACMLHKGSNANDANAKNFLIFISV